MKRSKTKTGKRWWWWVALVCTIVVVLIIPTSFHWGICWRDTPCRKLLFFGNGVLSLMVMPTPMYDPPLSTPSDIPKYGIISVTHTLDIPWRLLPRYSYFDIQSFMFVLPLHILLAVLLPAVIYPMLPIVKKRHRRKHGLCVKCAYDLTGNESGTCPECGTEIQA